jgi:hypothetical protein
MLNTADIGRGTIFRQLPDHWSELPNTVTSNEERCRIDGTRKITIPRVVNSTEVQVSAV